jgi:glycosyltransferase involved in cell wall biosynthesis
MNNYPYIVFLRWEKYSEVDDWFVQNKNTLDCSCIITSTVTDVRKLFNPSYQLLVTYGPDGGEYVGLVSKHLPTRMNSRWIHYVTMPEVSVFNSNVNYCFIDNVIKPRDTTRPIFSVFTSCFNSYDKIHRAYDSLKSQTLIDWEWVVLDDSPDDNHFEFLRKLSIDDDRIRLYRRDRNNGNIGNVKNETIGLCRGEYVLELDHDDEVDKDTLFQAAEVFKKYPEVGFVYMDFINIFENGSNFHYGDFLCKGYGGYYLQKYKGDWRYVYITPNVNNITMSHLVCCPNHPRIWKRKTLLDIGNYSELLPICDDYEILLRTAVGTKIAKICKIGYVQYMNAGSNNFSLIRNREINRIGPRHIQPMFYSKYQVHDKMKEMDAYEDPYYIGHHTQIWKRDENYEHKICNLVLNLDYDIQYCIIGADIIGSDIFNEIYNDPRNDIIVFDNRFDNKLLPKYIDMKGYDRVKCYYMSDCDSTMFENFFMRLYKSTENYKIIISETFRSPRETYTYQHQLINKLSNPDGNYLEIGIEYGNTFNKINMKTKIGTDPDPDYRDNNIIIKTSDEFFTNNNKELFDTIFIDGMHQSDYVLRDYMNSVRCIHPDGLIFIDDILPNNEDEQQKIPKVHRLINGIIKYAPGHPWTGDVWKTMYYLLKHHKDSFDFKCYLHDNYRGVGVLSNIKFHEINYETALEEINSYTYDNNFKSYLELILVYC